LIFRDFKKKYILKYIVVVVMMCFATAILSGLAALSLKAIPPLDTGIKQK
jgi:hypothetical protein